MTKISNFSAIILNVGMLVISIYTLFSVMDDSGGASRFAFGTLFPISFGVFMILSAFFALIKSKITSKKFLSTYMIQIFPMFYIIMFMYIGQVLDVYRHTGIIRPSGTYPE